jgi:hybrid cluster-associated redox disulfide protein
MVRRSHVNRTISLEAVMPVEPTQLVDDVMRRWPMTIRAFLNHRMHCVGCPIACFHTVADACREHGVDQAEFLTDLRAIIAQGSVPPARDGSAPITARWPA